MCVDFIGTPGRGYYENAKKGQAEGEDAGRRNYRAHWI